MIKRREFGKKLAAGVGATVAASTQIARAQSGRARAPKKNLLMHVGGDYHAVAGGPRADMTAKANLDYNLRHGVKHLTAQVRNVGADGSWASDELMRMRDNCDKAGMTFEAIRMDSEYIMLRSGPERDRRLDAIMGNIQKGFQGRRKGHHASLDGHSHTAQFANSGARRSHLRRFQAGGQLERSAGRTGGPCQLR